MRNIRLSDVTMKNSGAQGGFSLSFREKIELSKQLDRLGVSVIECTPIINARVDSLLIKSIASAVKGSTVCVPVTFADEGSIDTTWSALREAARPRLQVCAPVSSVQMEYFCHKKPDAMVQAISAMTAKCRERCPDVEFVAEDAGRSAPEFLRSAIEAAVQAGAATVTVCDTAGVMLPDEMGAFIAGIREYVPGNVALGVRCSNELYMADSCSLAAVRAGAGEVKCAACGGETASLGRLARMIHARGDVLDAATGVRTTELTRAVSQIEWMCTTSRSSRSPFDSGVRGVDESGVILTEHDDLAAVVHAAEKLGYDLSEEDGAKVYEAFRTIVSAKKQVGARELDAIVASAALQVPPAYVVESYVINSGSIITATSVIKMRHNGAEVSGVGLGDGPVDASFLAIEQIAGRHYELDDFQIQAVTEGREAMGETVVRLRSSGGKIYSGRGISTDIIGASIHAYVNALNKIVYEEGEA